MDYSKFDFLTPELRRRRFEERKRMKKMIMKDWERINLYYNRNVPITIYWRPYGLGGNVSGSYRFPGYVTISVRDDIDWFLSGSRSEVRIVLVHEMQHELGLSHGYKARKMGFYSLTGKDTYSLKQKRKIFKRRL